MRKICFNILSGRNNVKFSRTMFKKKLYIIVGILLHNVSVRCKQCNREHAKKYQHKPKYVTLFKVQDLKP